MMKEIQRKKKVLIDLTNYGSLTAGFGQIAANYATAFSSMPVDDLHFVYFKGGETMRVKVRSV